MENTKQKSRLLMKEQPIVTDRTLACLLGLNEAIVLQQIEYWVNIKETADKRGKKTIDQGYADGYYWTYNSVEDWTYEFPFWSYDTIKRTLKRLREKNILITANYNTKGYDRTLWYRVNHEELIRIDNSVGAKCTNEETSHSKKKKIKKQAENTSEGLKTDISAKCPNGLGQNAPMDQGKMPQPIPKTSTKISTETSVSKNSSKEEVSSLVLFFSEEICKLKKTTLPKFIKYADTYEQGFIRAIIEYGSETNAKSFSWFERVIESYISRNILTAEGVRSHIHNFHYQNEEAKNRALKQREEKRQASEQAHEREMAGFDVVDDFVAEDVPVVNTQNAIEVEEAKEALREVIKGAFYSIYIKGSKVLKMDENYLIVCPNQMTANSLEQKYYEPMRELFKNSYGMSGRLTITHESAVN